MTTRNIISRLRERVLQAVFQLLYSRLGGLHEAVGRAAYGAAWDGRRRHAIPAEMTGPLLDLGCGEGRLLASIASRSTLTIGIEPSTVMSRRASERGALVIRAAAQSLPLQAGRVQHVTATYPGPWILDPQTWAEVARVAAPGGSVQVLLGGDITRGRRSRSRALLLRLAYGSTGGMSSKPFPRLGNERVTGAYELIEDSWGQAIVWSGVRNARG